MKIFKASGQIAVTSFGQDSARVGGNAFGGASRAASAVLPGREVANVTQQDMRERAKTQLRTKAGTQAGTQMSPRATAQPRSQPEARIRAMSPGAGAAPGGGPDTVSQKPPYNPGVPLELDWIADVRVNRTAVERRAATLTTRRSVKQEWQAAWLLRAIELMDLTTLAGDDTPGRVRRLCGKARQPVRQDIVKSLGLGDRRLTTAALCTWYQFIPDAVDALHGSGIPVAAVSAGFPAGLNPLLQRIAEIHTSVDAGAREIDIVISRRHVLTGNWQALFDEVKAFKQACGDIHLKAIIAAGELGSLRNVVRASFVCMMAGADFIKTSTGKESVNATLPIGLVMVRAMRTYMNRTGFRVGFKPAGGIRRAKDALAWMILIKEELGTDWLQPGLFRLGASGLLTDIERQLEHHVTGRYAAAHRHPMG